MCCTWPCTKTSCSIPVHLLTLVFPESPGLQGERKASTGLWGRGLESTCSWGRGCGAASFHKPWAHPASWTLPACRGENLHYQHKPWGLSSCSCSPQCWCFSQGWPVFCTSFPTAWRWQEPRTGTAGRAGYMGIRGASPGAGLASQSHANISQAVMLTVTGIRERCFLNLTKWLCLEELIFFFCMGGRMQL